jgi:multicomponent Na+:H+ antiporter subunit D
VRLLPPVPVAVPLLVAAFLVGAGPFIRRRAADSIAVATAAAVTAVSAALLAQAGDLPIVYWFGGWTPRGGIALGVAFAVDQVGAALATLAGLLMTAALVFSWRYFEAVGTFFHALMLVFLAAVVGFCLSGDLFNLFVFFELLSVAAYALAGYRTEDPGSLQGALNFAVTNSVGAALVLCGIALLYGRTGALNLAQIGRALDAGPADRLVVVALVLLLAGFFVKAAVVPFHFWLADAYAVAPTPVCILLAGVVSELGLYAAFRVYFTVFSGTLGGHAAGLRGVLLGAAAVTALVGAVMCFLQHHLARLLSFATVSHVGVTLAGAALLAPTGAGGTFLYLIADGVVKASLFVCVGIVQHRLASVDERKLRGRGRDLPLTFGLLVAGALGLAGVPPFGTFLGKALMEQAASRAGHPWVPWLFVAASTLTAAAVLRAALGLFAGWGAPAGAGAPDPAADTEGPELEQEMTQPRPRTPLVMLVPAVGLLAVALALGLVPGLPARAERAAERFQDQTAYAAAVLDGATNPPTSAAGARAPAHLGSPLALAGLTATLAFGLALAALLQTGAQAGLGRAARRAWHPLASVLRGLHSGQVGDSITWVTVGTAGLGALLALVLR